MNKRLAVSALSLLLAGLTLLTACGSSSSPAGGGAAGSSGASDADSAATEAAETEDAAAAARDAYFARLGKGTDGASVVIASPNIGDEVTVINECYAEAENGSIMNDAVYRRNLEVEERTGLTIRVADFDDRPDTHKAVSTAILAGEASYDIIDNATNYLADLFNGGMLMNIDDISTVSLNGGEWWNKKANDAFSLRGQHFIVLSALNHTADGVAWFTMFNKNILKNYNLDDPYALVRGGTWTVDAMTSMMKTLPLDSNGDGAHDYNDLVGCIGQSFDAIALTTAFGCATFEKDGSDEPVFVLGDAASVSKFEKVYDFFNDTSRFLNVSRYSGIVDSIWDTLWTNKFLNDETLFEFNCSGNLAAYLDMSGDFGIIPMPKYDESQDGFATLTSIWFTTALSVPKVTAASPEDIGIVMEAMSYLSYADVEPTFSATYLTNRFIRDEDSVEMLDIVIASKTYDPSFCFMWGNAIQLPSIVAEKNSNTFASTIESSRSSIESAVQKTLSVLG